MDMKIFRAILTKQRTGEEILNIRMELGVGEIKNDI